ncbi:MAG: PEP/pyruvate-binding domain-containing protein [Deinococcales bacterium]
MDAVVPLDAAADVAMSGSKAANLAALMGLGVKVPEGVVVPASAFSTYAAGQLPDVIPDALLEDLYRFVGAVEPVAVRSSGIAEDLAGASFAGQYETVLNVRGRDALAAAVLHCWRSVYDPRVSLYQSQQGHSAAAMAVLVQRMLRVEAAGVAFTANPVTGARDEIVISAVPAVGEQLVSGESRAEEWVVRAGAATRLRAPVEALEPAQVLEVAAVARRIAEHFGAPQDVEWAFEDGVLHVLQARPMTALPEPVAWEPPDPNTAWVRNFRIGEWLPEPVTPLFASHVLPSMESAMAEEGQRWWGNPMTGTHALVNGWCFYAPSGGVSDMRMVAQMLLGLFRRPKTIVGLMAAMANPDLAVRWAIDPEEKRWREDRLPRYRQRVERGTSELDDLDPRQLVVLVSDLARMAGEMFWSMQLVLSCAASRPPRRPPCTRSSRWTRPYRPWGSYTYRGAPRSPSGSPPWNANERSWRSAAALRCTRPCGSVSIDCWRWRSATPSSATSRCSMPLWVGP